MQTGFIYPDIDNFDAATSGCYFLGAVSTSLINVIDLFKSFIYSGQFCLKPKYTIKRGSFSLFVIHMQEVLIL